MSATAEMPPPSPRLLALDASLARLRAIADDLERGSYAPSPPVETRRTVATGAAPPVALPAPPSWGPAAAFARAVGMSMVSTATAAALIVGVSAFGDPPRPTFADDGGSIPESAQPGQ